jgi:hypothetical protein
MVSERLERGEFAYGDKSFSREPAELLREIDEEIADVCGWSFILHVRVRRLIESIESQRRADPQFKTVNPKPKEAIHGNHEEQGS